MSKPRSPVDVAPPGQASEFNFGPMMELPPEALGLPRDEPGKSRRGHFIVTAIDREAGTITLESRR